VAFIPTPNYLLEIIYNFLVKPQESTTKNIILLYYMYNYYGLHKNVDKAILYAERSVSCGDTNAILFLIKLHRKLNHDYLTETRKILACYIESGGTLLQLYQFYKSITHDEIGYNAPEIILEMIVSNSNYLNPAYNLELAELYYKHGRTSSTKKLLEYIIKQFKGTIYETRCNKILNRINTSQSMFKTHY
jgi:hypothetical protein